jgi:hypothetical protein
MRPLEAVWLFGAPRSPFEAHGQIRIDVDSAGTPTVHASPGLDVQVFGDNATLAVQPL